MVWAVPAVRAGTSPDHQWGSSMKVLSIQIETVHCIAPDGRMKAFTSGRLEVDLKADPGEPLVAVTPLPPPGFYREQSRYWTDVFGKELRFEFHDYQLPPPESESDTPVIVNA